jgi:uncharacterized protein (UPF0548 family)
VATIRQEQHRDNQDRNQRWARFERATLFKRYGELHAQGLSQRQVAQELGVPRTTLQAWLAWQDRLDACPQVVEFFESVPGLAFLHRLTLALHVVFVEVGVCGIRLVCLFLQMTGLNRFVGASYGTQQQVNRRVEEAMVAYRQEESTRLAQEMPAADITLTQDETFTGGLCLVGIEPVSNSILLEHTAEARAQDTWRALMEHALTGLPCRVIQSTSDEAPGLLAYVEHHLGVYHSPDLFHVQHELSKAVAAPLAAKQRAATKAVAQAEETLKRVQKSHDDSNGARDKRGPGRPPTVAACLELALPFPPAQRVHDASPHARLTPASEVALDCMGIAKVRGHHPPLTPGLVDIDNAIDDAAQVHRLPPGSARPPLGCGQEALQDLPLPIANIGGIGTSRAHHQNALPQWCVLGGV